MIVINITRLSNIDVHASSYYNNTYLVDQHWSKHSTAYSCQRSVSSHNYYYVHQHFSCLTESITVRLISFIHVKSHMINIFQISFTTVYQTELTHLQANNTQNTCIQLPMTTAMLPRVMITIAMY